jgi:DNA-binding NarL/FixJ family response regulator
MPSPSGQLAVGRLDVMSRRSQVPITVLLADDHEIVRQGTRVALEELSDLKVVAEARDGEEALRLTVLHRPAVVLMDVSMPRLNGVEATRRIKLECPSTAVLVLTAYDDDAYIFPLIEAGAAGYLLKNARVGEIVRAVRAVAAGENVLAPEVAGRLVRRVRGTRDADKQVPLSERELEVLKLAARGFTNAQIARELVLSPRTVQAHLANIFAKMDVGSRTEAVTAALRQGWITLE